MEGVRRTFLAVLTADLVLVAVGVLSYRTFLSQPGGLGYLAPPVGLLLVYAAVVLAATRSTNAAHRRFLWVAAVVGSCLGLLEVVNISIETFTGLAGGANVVATAPLILGPFAVWSLVGGWAARATGALQTGVLAAVWSAMVTMVVGVTFGLVLALTARGRLARNLETDPDYLRSGWTDIRAFVLANTFDNGFTHLLGALVVGTVVGLIGGAIGVHLTPRRVAG
jgi:hypothetical protein